MKLYKNNEKHNIIQDSDITLSESYSGKTLSEVLGEQKNELDKLKSNIKWLAKYGGVGGNGGSGSGSSNIKTKYTASITYTQENGQIVTEEIKEGSSFIIKYGTSINVGIKLTQALPGTEYSLVITSGGKAQDPRYFNSNQLSTSAAISINNNTPITLSVFASPQDVKDLHFYVYNVAKTFDCYLTDTLGDKISKGDVFLQEYKENTEKSRLIVKLENFLDSQGFVASIDGLYINNTLLDKSKYEIQESKGASNETIYLISIPSKDVITGDFGIYTIRAEYSYGKNQATPQDPFEVTYIYKDQNMFIYCFSDNKPYMYQSEPSDGIQTSNNFLEFIKYRIYQSSSQPSTQLFRVTYIIIKEGKEDEAFEVVQTNKKIGVENQITVNNDFTDTDFLNKDHRKITIKFTVEAANEKEEFEYFFYVTKVAPFSFVFENTDDKRLFYQARYVDTFTTNLSQFKDPNLFPFTQGQYNLSSTKTYKFPQLKGYNNSGTPWVCSTYTNGGEVQQVTNYIDSDKTVSNGNRADAIFSFGLQYKSYNFNNPILKITLYEDPSNTSSNVVIILYKNKIQYGTEGALQEYTRWLIPQYNKDYDTGFHLIQIYFKSYYAINGGDLEFGNQEESSLNSHFLMCVDGIFESIPLDLGVGVDLSSNTSITYYPGNWDYNYIGLMSFNAFPSSMQQLNNFSKQVKKYKFDFDPIIPANFQQTYNSFMGNPNIGTLGSSIYSAFYGQQNINGKIFNSGINYYEYYDNDNIIGLNKFISVSSLQTISSLTTLPIYLINPVSDEKNKNINSFLYNTLSSYKETATDIPHIQCSLQVLHNGVVTSFAKDVVHFSITYQGSSTRLYSAKNFELSTVSTTDPNNSDITYDYYWTPDETKFKPETSFTLKCDMVDSSSSNNVVVGKFVNEYMKNSAFGGAEGGNKTCLEGFPILLFMYDACEDKGSSGGSEDSPSSNSVIFLGIYNFNLGRNSVINLGYKNLDVNYVPKEGEFGIREINTYSSQAKIYKVENKAQGSSQSNSAGAIQYNRHYRVAEVQDNSLLLYDYSQRDVPLLRDYMFDDFYNFTDTGPDTDFDNSLIRPFRTLANNIFNNFCKDLKNNPNQYADLLESDIQETIEEDLWDIVPQYVEVYTTDKTQNVFNVLKIKDTAPSDIEIDNVGDYYYYEGNIKINIPLGGKIFKETTLGNITPYILKYNNISIINNPFYQFHVVYRNNQVYTDASGGKYFYLEILDSLPTDSNPDDFDYDTLLRYYIICMAFAMVDSVQKNLTIRCENFNSEISNLWKLGFYDMDTSFGVNNAGNPVDFKAFSDFIQDDGSIVQDFMNLQSHSSEGSHYDAPSSFLFLWAKYGNLFKNDKEYYKNGILRSPYNYWVDLRDEVVDENLPCSGAFNSVDKFYNKYIDPYFEGISPLIWNLNYMYKYFSVTKNTSSTDTELAKFNGTRRHAKKEWLQKRFNLLDVLFGVRNNKNVGTSDKRICAQNAETINALKVSFPQTQSMAINGQMFPAFTKDVISSFSNIEVTTEPKSPIVVQITDSLATLYIANNQGIINNVSGNINSSTDVGFFGTKEIIGLSNCAPFLKYIKTEKNNTISNDRIETITISDLKTTSVSVALNLSEIKSAKTININNSKFTKLIINFSDANYRLLENLSITNSEIETIELSGPTDTMIINNLKLQNIKGSSLTLRNLEIKSFTQSGLNIQTYVINSIFPNNYNLNIKDSRCQNFTLNAQSNIQLTLVMNNASNISLENNINYVDIQASNCNSLSLTNLKCNEFKFYNNYYLSTLELNLQDSITSLKLKLSENTKLQNLSINGKNLKDIHYIGETFKKTLINSYKINQISIHENPNINIYLESKNIFYILEGSIRNKNTCIPFKNGAKYIINTTDISGLYFYCMGIDIEDVIQFFDNIKCNKTNINCSNLFYLCYDIDLQLELQTISNKFDLEPIQVPGMFFKFKKSLKESDLNRGKISKLDGMFTGTSMAILDKDLVDYFKRSNNLYACTGNSTSKYYNYIIMDGEENNLISPFEGISYLSVAPHRACQESSAGADLIGLSQSVIMAPITKQEVYNNDTGLTEEIYQTKILPVYKINEVLGSTVQYIHNFSMYTQEDVLCDCSEGLPISIKEIFNFVYYAYNVLHYKQLENLFKNFTESNRPIVFLDRFFRIDSTQALKHLNADDYETNINIKKLLLDDNNQFRCKFVIKDPPLITGNTNSQYNVLSLSQYNDSHECGWLRFNKQITAQEFKDLMTAYKQLQIDKLEDSKYTGLSNIQIPVKSYYGSNSKAYDVLFENIANLFRHCTITGVTSFEDLITYTIPEEFSKYIPQDLKEKPITYFDPLVRVVSNIATQVQFIDLEYTFGACTLLSEDNKEIPFDTEKLWSKEYIPKTRVLNLAYMFTQSRVKHPRNKFNLRGVYSMKGCFKNSQFINEHRGNKGINPAGQSSFPEGAYYWQLNDNFLIPTGFFTIGDNMNISNCFYSDWDGTANSYSFMGCLQSEFDKCPWWDENNVNLNSLENLFTKAALVPHYTFTKNDEDYYCLYPKWYIETFGGTNCYNHYTMPCTTQNMRFYLFPENTVIPNLSGQLPRLPRFRSGPAYYYLVLYEHLYVNNSVQKPPIALTIDSSKNLTDTLTISGDVTKLKNLFHISLLWCLENKTEYTLINALSYTGQITASGAITDFSGTGHNMDAKFRIGDYTKKGITKRDQIIYANLSRGSTVETVNITPQIINL